MFRRALSALGLNAAQHLLSEAEFAQRFLLDLEQAHPETPIDIVSDLSFTLNRHLDNEYRCDLDRVYAMYQMDPDRLDVLMHLHMASVTEALTLASVQITATSLIPLLRSTRDLEDLGIEPVNTDPLTNDLTIVYAFDLPHTLKYVTTDTLERLDLAREDVKAIAVANAERQIDRAVIDLHKGVVLVSSESTSPTSLLFVPAFWQQGIFATMPSIAVIVPDRDIVIAFDADSQEAILSAASIAAEIIAQSSAPMSKEVMLIKADPSAADASPAPSVAASRSTQRQHRDGSRASFG